MRCCCLLLAFGLHAAMDNIEAMESNEMNSEDEYAIQCAQDGSYTPNLTKDKRAVRKRAALLTVDKGGG